MNGKSGLLTIFNSRNSEILTSSDAIATGPDPLHTGPALGINLDPATLKRQSISTSKPIWNKELTYGCEDHIGR